MHLTSSFDGKAHKDSPFVFRVYDPEKIYIGHIPDGNVGDTIQFKSKDINVRGEIQ